MHSVIIETTKLILVGTRATYQAIGDDGSDVWLCVGTHASGCWYLKSQNRNSKIDKSIRSVLLVLRRTAVPGTTTTTTTTTTIVLVTAAVRLL